MGFRVLDEKKFLNRSCIQGAIATISGGLSSLKKLGPNQWLATGHVKWYADVDHMNFPIQTDRFEIQLSSIDHIIADIYSILKSQYIKTEDV